MKRVIAIALLTLLAAGCAHKEPTSSGDARKALEKKYAGRIGQAHKSELVEDFGQPEWCHPNEETGEETCRFFNKAGTRWMGDPQDRKHYPLGDTLTAVFDPQGVLRDFKVDSQR